MTTVRTATTDVVVGTDGVARMVTDAVAYPEARPSSPKRVLAFGDSLYAGYGLARGDALPAQIERRLRRDGWTVDVVNAGVSGETTAGGRARFTATLDRQVRVPDLVMIGLGANDLWRGLSPAQTRDNLSAMIAECRRRGAPFLLTGMRVPPLVAPAFVAAYNAIWPELAREHGAPLDPFILAGVVGRRELLLPDKIHPNATGVAVMAERLAPLVARALGTGRDDVAA